MSKKCYICNNEMEKKTTTITINNPTGKLTTKDIDAYVCSTCGEILIEGKTALMLQKSLKAV